MKINKCYRIVRQAFRLSMQGVYQLLRELLVVQNIQVAWVPRRLLWVVLPVHGLPSMQSRSRVVTADKHRKETNQATAACHKRCASPLQRRPPLKKCILLSCNAPE